MPHNQQKPKLKSEIDANLKRVYDSVLQEDLPDQLKELLERLRAQDKSREQSR
ncbi:MAG: NepR family anti-sigma factor [Pseudorhodobacter sp.]